MSQKIFNLQKCKQNLVILLEKIFQKLVKLSISTTKCKLKVD